MRFPNVWTWRDGWAPTTGYGPGTGGTPAANARAQRETWAATLAFLARALGPAAR